MSRNYILLQIEILGKIDILAKNRNFSKNQNYGQKSKFWTFDQKIEILVKLTPRGVLNGTI